MSEPLLTPAEERVADSLAEGHGVTRAVKVLEIKKRTVYCHIVNIAAKLAAAGLNPYDLKPFQLVSQWAFRRREKRKLSA